MALPSINLRVTPPGIRLDVGFQSVVSCSAYPSLAIFEKTIVPPSGDGGDPIMTTTMLNCVYETKAPQRLKGYSDSTIVAAYDPHVMSRLDSLINITYSWTWFWPDGTAAAYWAYLRKWEYQALEKDKQPEMTLTVVVTNWDPIACVEAGPVYYNGTGSCEQIYLPEVCYGYE